MRSSIPDMKPWWANERQCHKPDSRLTESVDVHAKLRCPSSFCGVMTLNPLLSDGRQGGNIVRLQPWAGHSQFQPLTWCNRNCMEDLIASKLSSVADCNVTHVWRKNPFLCLPGAARTFLWRVLLYCEWYCAAASLPWFSCLHWLTTIQWLPKASMERMISNWVLLGLHHPLEEVVDELPLLCNCGAKMNDNNTRISQLQNYSEMSYKITVQ